MTHAILSPDTPAHPATELMSGAASWAGIIGAWLAEVQQRTGSTRTPTEYGRYVAHFAARLSDQGRTLADATPADAHAFADAPLPDRRRHGAPGRKPGPASVNVRLAALRSLYDFARRIGAVSTNPADGVKRPQLPQATPKGLTPAQTRELLAQAPQTLSGQRDRAIILAAVLTGLRREELIALTASAIGLGDDRHWTPLPQALPGQHGLQRLIDQTVRRYNECLQVHGAPPRVSGSSPPMVKPRWTWSRNLHTGLIGLL